jgi:hypothetical protein
MGFKNPIAIRNQEVMARPLYHPGIKYLQYIQRNLKPICGGGMWEH